MSKPMDRSDRLFKPTNRFDEAFPTLEDATIHYTEFEFGNEDTKGIVSLRREGGIMRCRNTRCIDGGYELDREVSRMIHDDVLENTVTLYCSGHEGTRRRRGDSCDGSVEVMIKLKLKH
jgi:hypothetical protein